MKNFILFSSIFLVGFVCGFFYSDSQKQPPTISPNQVTSNRIEEIIKLTKKPTQKTEAAQNTEIKNSSKNETNNTEEKISSYDKYVSYIHTSQFQNAIDIYQNSVTNDNIKQYQDYLFKYIENMILEKDLGSFELIDKFIKIEYNNTYALYLQSKILFQNGYFEKAIFALNDIKAFYLEKEFEAKINTTIDDFITFYVQRLQKSQDYAKLINFLEILVNQYPDNPKYAYGLAKIHFELNNYDASKDLLLTLSNDEIYKNRAQKLLDIINREIKLSQKFSQKIELEKKDAHFFVKAVLNDDVEVRLLLDTGASQTVIDDSIMDKVNYTITDDKIELNTAGGFVMAKQVQINTFNVSGTVVNNMQIISSKMYDDNFDGLLGMGFFKQFDFYIDQENSILYLNQKLN